MERLLRKQHPDRIHPRSSIIRLTDYLCLLAIPFCIAIFLMEHTLYAALCILPSIYFVARVHRIERRITISYLTTKTYCLLPVLLAEVPLINLCLSPLNPPVQLMWIMLHFITDLAARTIWIALIFVLAIAALVFNALLLIPLTISTRYLHRLYKTLRSC